MKSIFSNKTLLITGGTGSFGSTVVDYFLTTDINEIRIFSRDEKKQDDMRIKYKNDKLNFIIGDTRDYNSITSAISGVDYIFQAAALKQVPSCEFFPLQAVNTNILGSENVLEAALVNEVKKIVVLSTDKAVYPINAMGMSKALMEKIAIAKARDPRAKKNNVVITATRYGNVMCSRGSIIPLFISQILNNQPLTITNPKMTRFMMSLQDSVNLVLFAFNSSDSGDLFVQKSPATTIENLAIVLKDIFHAKNDIKIIGTRHGEKLHETLCSKEEMEKSVDLGNYYKVPADFRDLNYSKFENKLRKNSDIEEYNSANTEQLEYNDLKKLLLSLDYVKDFLR